MAATPPMPPGSNSYQLNGSSSGISNSNSKNPAEGNTNNISEAIHQHFLRKKDAPPTSLRSQRSRCGSYEQLELLEHPQPAAAEEKASPAEAAAAGGEAGRKQSTHCHCTNISIMHLFHEMKQEFPTIPDAIVTQCVSENCHQRDNCIQMLKKELALHPIPAQSYPAKVLQQQQQRQAKPPTPLKPSRVAPTQPPEPSQNGNGNANGNGDASPSPTHSPSPQPRPRPTTLNLQRQLNAQLQQKIQQRQQRQQRDQQPPQLTPTSLTKPLRRAPPLPPAPGPPLAPKPSFSNDSSCLTSPMSSSESEFSLNAVSLSSPTSATRATAAAPSAAATAATATATTPQQASPVRHRSVINLQPELPYARDFLSNSSALSPALTPPTLPGSPGSASAVSPGRKSFTSLNLTLRQPTGGAQSAIDITAGPAPSGQGSGITYSSVSFDARRGTHKNFQLTVTDEGSVFSAGCIRPQAPYAACEPQQQTAVPPPRQPPPVASLLSTDGLSPSDCDMPEVFPYPTQAQNHVVASNYNTNHAADNNNGVSSSHDSSPVSMPLYAGVLEECDPEARAATIERQKKRRDKLANALRDNKKRLLVLEQEINILTEPVPVGESERLDRDMKKLTEDCQRLLNLINEHQANGSGAAPNSMNRQNSASANNIQQQQQQPQPFPRQRQTGRSQAPPSSLRLHSVPSQPTAQPSAQPGPDFVQHHSSAPTSACLTPQQQQQLQLQQAPPPTYAQYYQFQQYLQQQRQQQLQQFQLQQQQSQQQQQQQQPQMSVQRPSANDEEEYPSDSDGDDDEEPLDMWACNMCTFRNHPQLNICEACENVRIQPGMIRIVPSGGGPGAADGAAGSSAASLEQQQQPQQPQQPYALHT